MNQCALSQTAGALGMSEAVKPMASVTILYHFADGDEITARVEVDASYPDACAEARMSAVATFREALGTAIEAITKGDDA